MKRVLLYLLALSILTFVSCEKSDDGWNLDSNEQPSNRDESEEEEGESDESYNDDPGSPLNSIKCEKNEIIYISIDKQAIHIDTWRWNVKLIDNSYINGIGKWTFDGNITEIPIEFIMPEELERIKLPNSVNKIPPLAFKNCENLIGITMPNSITEIGNAAFAECI